MEPFPDAFERLTGNPPFPWQSALFEMFLNGDFPETCTLPTGLGKTSIMAVWLIALAHRSEIIPRRLVYVVNRRTVVDQSTDEAQKLRENLPKCPEIVGALRALAVDPTDKPLAISTLRGQFADNAEWRDDPARAAIIAGTVDMIGSRLLFSGYRCGFKSKPTHAGLLGQDTILIHDEAHLEPAFQELLIAIKKEQRSKRSEDFDFRKFHVMELTATARLRHHDEITTGQRSQDETATNQISKPKVSEPFRLRSADYEHPIVVKRIRAKKQLRLFALPDDKKLHERILERALEYQHSGAAVLVFVRTVEDVEKVVNGLKAACKKDKREDCVEQLTGTLRGYERDRLTQSSKVFARFLPESNRPENVEPLEGTVYLVCTSAGEVGVNISADHLVCDLSTFESMAQRFGRVNRFGDGDAQIDVIFETDIDASHPYHSRRLKTLELLQRLPTTEGGHLDASPDALSQLPANACVEAYAPEPERLELSDILLDSWALTTINEPCAGRPPVEAWLHGLTDDDPQITVAWRQEVDEVRGTLLQEHPPEKLLEAFPLKPLELLSDRAERVFSHLQKLAKGLKQPRRPESKPVCEHVWVIRPNGSIEVQRLAFIADPEAKTDRAKRLRENLHHCTVLLPPSIGGLSQGMLDGDAGHDTGIQYDVSEEWKNESGKQRRARRKKNEPPPEKGMRKAYQIVLSTEAEVDDEEDQAPNVWTWYVLPRSADDDDGLSWSAPFPQQLTEHLQSAGDYARILAEKLGLDDRKAQAIEIAARFHDLGKARRLWQMGIGNDGYDPAVAESILAKSGNSRPPINRHYRHEFGTLMDVQGLKQTNGNDALLTLIQLAQQQLADDEEIRDLTLHLIAAHHGRGRPHFPAAADKNEAFDPECPEDAANDLALEIPRRFARLQRRYGRWGLAWLESIVKAADVLASRNPKDQSPANQPAGVEA